jgi:hypothetical protein
MMRLFDSVVRIAHAPSQRWVGFGEQLKTLVATTLISVAASEFEAKGELGNP